ncbi:LGFP repeat-containing protein [Mycolicibacillus trivialis]
MSRQRSQMGKWVRGAALAVVAAATAASYALLAPAAGASPETDAHDAITAAWDAAGGNDSRLGAPQGDVYPVGAGFAADYTGGKIFFTPATGARAMYGPILDTYESLGGPAGSDLGFPDMDQTPGLAGPEAQFISFSATDNPLIFFTPEHGAYVVRGPINAAWDTLNSSSGPLGPPAGAETFDGDTVTQKFANGEVGWNRKTRAYTTTPPELAAQLADLQVAVTPEDAINAAWRATGGAGGPLGARQGEQEPIGDDGLVQGYAGGKIFYSPTTGANAVEGAILEKYDSLGGPQGSDLGFPTENPTDTGDDAQVSPFAAADQPVIYWSSEHGAFVVRGAMKAAWDKLGGAGGDLGAPVGDQSADGDLISQEFSGGTISWNQAENSFTTDPASLGGALSGLQIPGVGAANAPTTGSGQGIGWHWWWLPVSLGVLVLAGLLAWLAWWGRRRRAEEEITRRARNTGRRAGARRETAEPQPWAPELDEHEALDGGGPREVFYDLDESGTEEFAESGMPSRVAWAHRSGEDEAGDDRGGEIGGYGEDHGREAFDYDPFADPERTHRDGGAYGDDFAAEESDEDPDDVDTAPTRIPAEAELGGGRHSAVEPSDAAEESYRVPGGAFVIHEAAHDHPGQDDLRHDDARYQDADPRGHGSYGDQAAGGPAAGGDQAGGDQAGDDQAGAHPAIHLPLSDPYQAPAGYPIKANTVSGLYYTPDNALYHDTLAEVWFATEAVAQANGFLRAE